MYNKKNNGESGFISYYLGMIKYQGTMTLVKLSCDGSDCTHFWNIER